MPNWRDSDPVSYGRWQEAHARLEDRLDGCEARLTGQITDLRGDIDELMKAARDTATRRRDRMWIVALAILTGLILPLAVTALLSLNALH